MTDEKTIISIKGETPAWANWIFRVVLVTATTLNTAIVNAPGISEAMQLKIVYWSGLIATLIWAISRALGKKIDPIDATNKFADGPGGNPPGPGNPKTPGG